MPPLTLPLRLPLCGLLVLYLCLARLPARAEPALHSYALIIGSNRGGNGQGTLDYAQHDAARVSELLRELGRTPRDNIQLLTEPGTADVEQALATLRDKLSAHAAAGEQAQVLFYYSGHARAHALSLGEQELSLSALRASLLALPSTLTVVVLDACQSGAFSGVKGARKAADFSFSSVRDLHSRGIAVMASSTGTELSQESRELGSSYFTHHLLVSLRGAGDLDRDGRVSLDEAYRYAYQRTLSDTARTQVGSQHATLETELTGRGDVPLSYPVDADAQLALPADVAGRVLVQQKGGAVMAELVKARGGTLLLALPSGDYEVLVRGESEARSCAVTLQKGTAFALSLASCQVVALPEQRAKSDHDEALRVQRLARESWFMELGVSLSVPREDAYIRTLRTFEYGRLSQSGRGLDAVLGLQIHKNLSLLLRFDDLEYGSGRRRSYPDPRERSWSWDARAVMLGARARLPVASHWVVAFAELDGGLALASTRLQFVTRPTGSDIKQLRVEEDKLYAPALRGLLGFTFGFARHFGAYLAGGFTYAPVLKNELGQRHNSGGVNVLTGIRLNAVKGWW